MDDPQHQPPDAEPGARPGDAATGRPGSQAETVAPGTDTGRAGTPFTLPPSPSTLASPGKTIGPYEILGELGRGGMGVVYKAFHPGLKRTVALKVLIAGEDASPEAIARFHREAEAVAQLGHHPNIVPVYDIGQVTRDAGAGATGRSPLHYFAMHFVAGESLDRRIDEGGIPPKQAALVAKKIAEALQHAHAHGILHRDVKPANILLANPDPPDRAPRETDHPDRRATGADPVHARGASEAAPTFAPDTSESRARRGSGPEGPPSARIGSGQSVSAEGGSGESGFTEPMLTDFGLAKDIRSESRMTLSGVTLGTPNYMPPEQAEGRIRDIDARSDVYSLGATLYETLTLRPPFDGDAPAAVIREVLLSEPVPLRRAAPAVDRDLETICLKCLEKDPARRYATAGELAEDLGRYLEGKPILARPPGLPRRLRRFAGRHRTPLLAALSAAVSAGILAAVVALYPRERVEPPVPTAGPQNLEAKRSAALKMDEGRSLVDRLRKSVLLDDPASYRTLVDRALESFESACTLDPGNAEAFLEKGKVLVLLRKSEEAIRSFDRAIELNPVLSDSYFGRIQVRRASFFVTAVLSGEEAAREARALIESDLAAIERIGIKPHVALCGRALPLIIEGKNEEALDLIDRAIRIDGAFAEGYSSRASLRLLMSGTALGALRTALLESALKDFTKALLISGEDTDFRIGRVEVLTQLKRWKEALAEADALVIVLHDTPFSYLQRAQVRMALGDEAGFEEDMKRAEELPFPTPEMHLAATGIILGGHKFNGLGIIKTKEIERALRHLDQLIRKCPERRDIQGIRGMLLMLLGRRAEALAAFQGYLQEYPKAKIAATVFLLQSVLRTGIDLSNDAPFLPFFQAGQRLQRGEAAEAEGLYREALRRLEAPHGPLPPAERASRENIARSGRVTLARLVVKRAAAEGGGAAKGAWLEEALELLDRAVALGYADLKSIDEDPAWAPLRALPGFGPKREAWGRQGK